MLCHLWNNTFPQLCVMSSSSSRSRLSRDLPMQRWPTICIPLPASVRLSLHHHYLPPPCSSPLPYGQFPNTAPLSTAVLFSSPRWSTFSVTLSSPPSPSPSVPVCVRRSLSALCSNPRLRRPTRSRAIVTSTIYRLLPSRRTAFNNVP